VPLSLEIGVIDIDTCEPLEDVLVDIWVSGKDAHSLGRSLVLTISLVLALQRYRIV
jgi:hypothetical protein